MAEFRIMIGPKSGSSGRPAKPPGKLELLKAALLGILGLAVVIGILLAALVVGSIIASVLLILLATVLVVWLANRIFVKLKRLL